MEIAEIIHLLTLSPQLVSAKNAEQFVPSNTGLYSIFIDNPNSLPEPFRGHLIRQATTLIYVGQASVSLRKRLVDQDLRHVDNSTFFRGIGAVLGFRPPTGSLRGKKNQDNYKFSTQDAQAIIRWVNEHLAIRWVLLDVKTLGIQESMAINVLRPILNTVHNPDSIPELSSLRDICRQVARG